MNAPTPSPTQARAPEPAPHSQLHLGPAAARPTCPDHEGRRWIPRPAGPSALEALPREDPPPIALTPRERAIVELLAQGHTDETAARELDLSRRTVGYALGGLMSRLGVDNRFQLGLALGAMRAAVPTPRAKT